jgi:predicted AAA+ superfamily ATPase
VDLLDPEFFRDLQKSPNFLREIISGSKNNIVIIDEIQKIPELLDVVHSLIESNKKLRFILTGSSARKIRNQGKNLLGGRAYPLSLHPITSVEYLSASATSQPQNLHRLIEAGGLPQVLTTKSPQRLLKAYVGIYLQEEIKAEGYVRNLGDFSKFLDVAALSNTEQIDYAGIARDVQLSPRTVSAYYQILQDTLTGFLLESFKETKSRKAVITPKFYFFDVGISNYLTGREKLSVGTPEYGKALEHFIFTELKAYQDYSEKAFELYYWRSTSQMEVDFIIKTKSKKLICIEVKGSQHIDKTDLKGLKAFEEDFKISKKIVVCNERLPRLFEGVEVLPYANFCHQLWADQIIQIP